MTSREAEQAIQKLRVSSVDIISGNIYVATIYPDGRIKDEVDFEEVPQDIAYFGDKFELIEVDGDFMLRIID
jgi:tartrate dehydratase beta subunit/fumarate hydratase class I family protein